MALGLPRRLAPVLPTIYSPSFLRLAKAYSKSKHLGFPYHAFAHCKDFAPAAPLRARTLISVSFSRWGLSSPLLILGLVSLYLTNSLISRRLILWRFLSGKEHSSAFLLSGFNLSFPRVSQTKGQIIDVLLSPLPPPYESWLAWLTNPNSSDLPQDQRELLSQNKSNWNCQILLGSYTFWS